MKITKRVEEYIRSKVTDKYKYIGEAEQKKYEQDVEEFAAYCKDTVKEMNELVRKKFPDFDWKNDDAVFSYSTWRINPNSFKVADQKKAERRQKIDDKVYDIIIRMELGGTKEDLDRMLNED